jgi:hypothetical protein
MDYVTTLTCEYIFNKTECITYLTYITINPESYKHIYDEYDISSRHNKRIRKLKNIHEYNINDYVNVMSISFATNFNTIIYHISSHITHLIFGALFDRKLPKLPHSLIYLKFGKYYNQKLVLLPNLIHLEFDGNFNHKLPILPKTLQRLILSNGFNHKISRLPDNLTHLKLGWCYNKQLPKLTAWPKNMIQLILGFHYNHQICTFPPQLRMLKLGTSFNLANHTFPPMLKYLKMYCAPKFTELPIRLTHFMYGGPFVVNFPKLSDNLIHLTWFSATKLHHLPAELQYFSLECESSYFNYDCEKHNPEIKQFPDNLTHLTWECNLDLPNIPDSLIFLKLGRPFNKKIPQLPINIREIYVYDVYEHIADLKLYGDKIKYVN